MTRELNVGIKLTNAAINQIEKLLGIVSDYDFPYRTADILGQIFEEEYYDYYFQNATRGDDEETKVRILMASDTDNRNNLSFIRKYDGKILALEGINVDSKNFLIINIKLLPKNVGSESNKCILAKVKFYSNNSIRSSAIPDDLMEQLSEMPNAQELYRKVDKNIKDWDNYLAIIEENAKNSQLEIEYTGFKQEDLLTHCVFSFNKFNSMQIEKLKKFRSERVVLFYKRKTNNLTYNNESNWQEDEDTWEDIEDYIGTIDKINFKNNTIKIELEPEFQELALEGELDFPQMGNLRISKMGDLAQARNLRRGLNLLRIGQAHNPDLDVILFNSKTLGENRESNIVLSESNLLLKTLNNNQKLAVEGVLNAKDLFLIQGPPGTGKTTVIAEICYQNAIRGKKTLISSQSNLAVDNALSRLIHNPKIRVLRKGNLSRVEKEGEKYTENNVVDTWLGKTADSCKKEFEVKQRLLKRINNLESNLEKVDFAYRKKDELENSISEIRNNIKFTNEELQKIFNVKDKLNNNFKDMEWEIWTGKNIYGFSNTNSNILTILNIIENTLETREVSNLLEESGDLDKVNSYNELKMIFNEIEQNLKRNYIKQNEKKELLRRIEELHRINNTVKTLVISDIERQFKKSKFDNCEITKYIDLSKTEESNKLKVINELNLMKNLKDKLNNSIKLLEVLKNEYKINDVVIVDNELSKEITQQIIGNFESQVANLYNYKPNKFIILLGLKKKWKVDIITKLHIAEKYREYTDSIINELKVQKDIHEEKLKSYINVLSTILSRIEASENEKLGIVEHEIDLNISKILRLEDEHQQNKNYIIDIIEKKQQMFKESLLNWEINLQKQKEEVSSIVEEIKMFNTTISQIVNSSLNLEEIAKYKDIKNYYQKILEPKKVITTNYVEIVGEWIDRIRQKKYGDKSELKDLYINTANVIGITCVQSGSRDFTEKYPDFDVVIVDEVSKATPPELVLPMLKGKKLVLVGDHKQLPPMIGSETFEELKVLSNKKVAIDSEIDDLEYMKKSLFEELFINVGESNKVMLNTQYRMHSSIMNTINQFYIDSENKGLICGVENEESVKNHKLETKYLNQSNNLIWVDIPLHKNFHEKLNAQNSCYNETEVEVIDKMLKDINESCEILGVKKEVAVITFYGAQAKLLQKELISNNKYNNLKLRVGTVDRFQGMEREIVIVSFVRNNNKGKIGFAKDPKRINVALSRAQNLLVIVGCSELFCEKNFHKEARENYKNVLKVVDSYNGIIDAKEIFN